MPLGIRGAILVVVLIQFFIGHGPIWKHMFDWDRSILWSYATIPTLVALALAVRRRFAIVPWFLYTLELACIKFAITASVLLGFLIATGRTGRDPPVDSSARRPVPETSSARAPERRLPEPSRIPAETGTLSGVVMDRQGKLVSGALVFVSEGLEPFVFAPPKQELLMIIDSTGFSPALAAVQRGQPIAIRSTNRVLHTVRMRRLEGGSPIVFNLPVLVSGARTPLNLDETADGLTLMECAVHGKKESPAYLGVFGHPFFALVGPDSRFQFEHVPAASLKVAAFLPNRGRASETVVLEPQGSARVTLRLP